MCGVVVGLAPHHSNVNPQNHKDFWWFWDLTESEKSGIIRKWEKSVFSLFQKTQKVKKMEFKDFESSAIQSLTTKDNNLTIVFKSSDKEYNYSIIDSKFEELLTNTIKNKESVGKFINISLKEKNIVELVNNSK